MAFVVRNEKQRKEAIKRLSGAKLPVVLMSFEATSPGQIKAIRGMLRHKCVEETGDGSKEAIAQYYAEWKKSRGIKHLGALTFAQSSAILTEMEHGDA